MDNYNSNYDIALQIGIKVGIEQIDYDSSYSICRAIHKKLTGTDADFDSTYSILNAIYRHLGGTADDFDSVYSVLEAINVALGGDSQDDIYDVLLDILDNYGPVPPTPTTYTVSYNANTGQGTMVDSNSPYASGATVTVLSNTFTKEGYTFDGWNTRADGTGTSYVSGQTFIITGNTTLYAQWEEIPVVVTFTMSYSNNGGEGTMTDSNSPYESGATVTVLSNAFTKEGYNFDGWNTSADGTGTSYAAGGTFTITADTTLYAQWEEIPASVKFTAHASSTIGLAGESSHQTLEYSTNGSTWTPMTTATTISVSSGDSVYVRGLLSGANGSSDYTQFAISGDVHVSGLLDALFSKNESIPDMLNGDVELKDYCAYGLFLGCTGLTSASGLIMNAKSVPSNGYCVMFRNCTNLASVPALPATTLGINCYSNMFRNCTSMTSAPSLPATSLASGCYSSMFRNCSSITTAPELPATTLAENCYNAMFYECSGMTVAPVLNASTLAAGSYQNMFGSCSSLSAITCMATDISASACTSNWVSGVSASGVFKKEDSMSGWTTGASGIPRGWTVVDYA